MVLRHTPPEALNPYSIQYAKDDSYYIFAALIEVEGNTGRLQLLYDNKRFEEIVRATL